jgi:hypothetical protein
MDRVVLRLQLGKRQTLVVREQTRMCVEGQTDEMGRNSFARVHRELFHGYYSRCDKNQDLTPAGRTKPGLANR